MGETPLLGPDFSRETTENIKLIWQRLLTDQSRQKCYANKKRRTLEFEARDHAFLHVSPKHGVLWFKQDKKLLQQFIGPFKVLEHMGEVAYRFALPPHLSRVHNVFHVSMLRKYEPTKGHILKWPEL